MRCNEKYNCADGITTLCYGPVKPNVVFFGEPLPPNFLPSLESIKDKKCDLMIILGTSLAVAPFNKVVSMPHQDVPRVLINLENTDQTGFDFDDLINHPERLFLKGKCDDVIQKLLNDAGKSQEFAKIYKDKK